MNVRRAPRVLRRGRPRIRDTGRGPSSPLAPSAGHVSPPSRLYRFRVPGRPPLLDAPWDRFEQAPRVELEAQLPQHRVDLGTHVVRLNRSRLGALSDPLEPAGYAQRCGAPQPEGSALEWRACAIAKRRIDERL